MYVLIRKYLVMYKHLSLLCLLTHLNIKLNSSSEKKDNYFLLCFLNWYIIIGRIDKIFIIISFLDLDLIKITTL